MLVSIGIIIINVYHNYHVRFRIALTTRGLKMTNLEVDAVLAEVAVDSRGKIDIRQLTEFVAGGEQGCDDDECKINKKRH